MGRNKHQSRNIKKLGYPKIDQILHEAGYVTMHDFDLEKFKRTHPKLYLTIKRAMLTYAIECIDFIEPNNYE